MEKKKLSTTYKLLRALGFNYSEEEYGDVIIGVAIVYHPLGYGGRGVLAVC